MILNEIYMRFKRSLIFFSNLNHNHTKISLKIIAISKDIDLF